MNFYKFLKISIVFLVIIAWIFSGWPRIWQNPAFPPKIQEARADTIADSTPGTVASVADAGTGCTNLDANDWGTMTNTITSNDAYAIYGTGNFFDASEVSEEFQLSNFGISIPDGSTINGITVAIERKGTSADIQDRNINLTKTAGVQLGTNKAVAADWGTTDATATYGSGSDVWGTTWSEAEVEASGFGFVICVQTLAGDTNGIASIDFINITITYTAVAPTVSTQAATLKEATTATCNGTIDVTGGANATAVGCDWDIDSGVPYTNNPSTAGDYGAVPFTQSLTGLPTGTTIYARAFATNSAGTGYGGEVNFLTKPAAPTGVSATENLSDKVTITWTKPTGATDYHVWRGAVDLGSAGDVATFDDTGGNAPTITPGTTVASDGASTAQVDLSLSGTSANEGTSYDYTVVASNATGNSAASTADAGYRKIGSLTYQWQRSASITDAGYSNIDGATNSTYNDTGAPAPTVTPGTASATDGSANDKVTLSISGDLANVGEVRYYKCNFTATGASPQTSIANDGYRDVGSLTYLWYRSSGITDSDYSSLGATTDPYDDTTAPAPTITAGTADASDGTSTSYVSLSLSGQSTTVGAVRWFYATVSATDASPQNTTHNDGYRGVGAFTYQWQRSAADSDAGYSPIGGATTETYNDTDAPADGSGRYFKCVENADGADQQTSTANRGYRLAAAPTLTFSISDNTIEFGALLTTAVRWADDSGGSPTETSAHTLGVSISNASGYSITVKGDTLKYSSYEITAIGGAAVDVTAGGSIGTKQFGIRLTVSGGGSVVAPYNEGTNMYAYAATATTEDEVGYFSGASDTSTFSVYYAANIDTATEAGSYTSTLTYIATGNF